MSEKTKRIFGLIIIGIIMVLMITSLVIDVVSYAINYGVVKTIICIAVGVVSLELLALAFEWIKK